METRAKFSDPGESHNNHFQKSLVTARQKEKMR